MLDAHGPMPEIEAWARLTQRRPERWEIDALFRLDHELYEAQR